MEMGLDSSSREVDQQGAHQHLSNCDDMTGEETAGAGQPQVNGQANDDAAQKYGGPKVQVHLAETAVPCPRGDADRDNDACQPLKDEQPHEETIRTGYNALAVT